MSAWRTRKRCCHATGDCTTEVAGDWEREYPGNIRFTTVKEGDRVGSRDLSQCRYHLVPFLFHDLTSLHSPSFH